MKKNTDVLLLKMVLSPLICVMLAIVLALVCRVVWFDFNSEQTVAREMYESFPDLSVSRQAASIYYKIKPEEAVNCLVYIKCTESDSAARQYQIAAIISELLKRFKITRCLVDFELDKFQSEEFDTKYLQTQKNIKNAQCFLLATGAFFRPDFEKKQANSIKFWSKDFLQEYSGIAWHAKTMHILNFKYRAEEYEEDYDIELIAGHQNFFVIGCGTDARGVFGSIWDWNVSNPDRVIGLIVITP